MKEKKEKIEGNGRRKEKGNPFVTVYSISAVIAKRKVKTTRIFEDIILAISLLNNNDKYERKMGERRNLGFVYDEKYRIFSLRRDLMELHSL